MKKPYKPEPCPKCGESSECVDWCEVDIGVGLQTFDPEYQCPAHGRFAFKLDALIGYADRPPEPIFRDEE